MAPHEFPPPETHDVPDDNRAVTNAPSTQIAYGDYSAVAGPGGTAIVNVYQQAPPRQVDAAEIERAKQQLARLPLDQVPAAGNLPSGSRMPLRHNPLFVGRDNDLIALATCLRVNQTAAVTGIGGVGKTQLASEFVHRYGQYFLGGVYWLSFAEPNGIAAEMAACGGVGGLELRPDYHLFPLSDQVRLISAAWQSSIPRLLIFDNCEEEALLAQWRPPTGESRVLVTSRRVHWNLALDIHTIALGLLERTQSVSLLAHYLPEAAAADDALLGAIAETLGDLPLALQLAGGFLATYHRAVTPATYLAQLRDDAFAMHDSLVGRGSNLSPTNHELHVARTFALSYDRLDADNPTDWLARALLARVAYFAGGEPIPRGLLRNTLPVPDDDLDQNLLVEDSFKRLTDLGLLDEASDDTVRQHRLLTAVLRAPTRHDAQAEEDVEHTLIAVFRTGNVTGDLRYNRSLELHLRSVTERALRRKDQRTVELCSVLGNHLRRRGIYAEALVLLQQALDMDVALHPTNDPSLARSYNDLGLVLLRMGSYDAAKQHLTRAHRLFTKNGDLQNKAATLDNIGQLHTAVGEYKQARRYITQALSLRERELGPAHLSTAVSIASLGYLLVLQGRLAEARERYERAFTIRQGILGSANSSVADSLFALAQILELEGKFAASAEAAEQALAIHERGLGPNHPSATLKLPGVIRPLILNGMIEQAGPFLERMKAYLATHDTSAWEPAFQNNLGLTLWHCGDHREAYIHYNAIPPDRRETDATILNNIAMALVAFEEYGRARAMYDRAVTLQQRAGANDPFLARFLHNSSVLHRKMGEWVSARTAAESALRIRTAVLGAAHRDTAISLTNIGLLCNDEGDYTTAERQIRQALGVCQQLYGDNHPDTAQMLHDLGAVLHGQGRNKEAQVYIAQALAIRERTLPARHPALAETLLNLGKLQATIQQSEAAQSHLHRAAAIYQFRYGDNHSGTRDSLAQLARFPT